MIFINNRLWAYIQEHLIDSENFILQIFLFIFAQSHYELVWKKKQKVLIVSALVLCTGDEEVPEEKRKKVAFTKKRVFSHKYIERIKRTNEF